MTLGHVVRTTANHRGMALSPWKVCRLKARCYSRWVEGEAAAVREIYHNGGCVGMSCMRVINLHPECAYPSFLCL